MKYPIGDFDVVYFYCPFSDHDKQRVLEERIIKDMKPGAILIAHLPQSGLMGMMSPEELYKSGRCFMRKGEYIPKKRKVKNVTKT